MKTTLENLQSMDIPGFLLPPEIVRQAKEAHKRALPVNGDTPWQRWEEVKGWRETLFIRAESWHPMPGIYDDLPAKPQTFGQGQWSLHQSTLPPSQKLRTYMKGGDNPRMGWVQFDAPVQVPTLCQNGEIVMSLTPSELLSLAPGVKAAKGDVIITGLGLGWLLLEVSKRKQVTRLRVIERDPYVLAMAKARLKGHLKRKVEFILGDCNQKLDKMKADVLLADHFSGFGWNSSWTYRLKNPGNFGKVWCWG